METFITFMTNPQNLVMLVVGISSFITIMIIAGPMLSGNSLDTRMKSVADERKRLRARQLDEMNKKTLSRERPIGGQISFMKSVVDKFNLRKAFESEETTNALRNAGFRGQAPIYVFLFFRLAVPVILIIGALAYFFGINNHGLTNNMIFVYSFGIMLIGFYLPNLYLKNVIAKRQDTLRAVFPDTMDLLLICVESGMAIEAAFNKVATEVAVQSTEMAEELALTTAELSYLSSRRMAYRNFATRTGLDEIKSLTTSLVQAEQYGTPLGTALRVISQENRDARMTRAEKKAASLPPKLTVPMILFFLPVIFVVILGPTIMMVSKNF
ncbi:MAG: type II secretion system F family protein [Rhizobiales bacterium]|nr:type II secretion system F family protein [Hyphomicrobiales bacterium]NRB14263.1 type II secretion system F family protein [Hyphomicrobiales bacterium]